MNRSTVPSSATPLGTRTATRWQVVTFQFPAGSCRRPESRSPLSDGDIFFQVATAFPELWRSSLGGGRGASFTRVVTYGADRAAGHHAAGRAAATW
jgi:hypothetical protein